MKDFKQEIVTGTVLKEIIPAVAKTQNYLHTITNKEWKQKQLWRDYDPKQKRQQWFISSWDEDGDRG